MCRKCQEEAMEFVKWLIGNPDIPTYPEGRFFAVGLYSLFVCQKNHPEDKDK